MHDIKNYKLNIKNDILKILFLSIFAVISASAHADDSQNSQAASLQGYSLSAYQNEYSWRENSGDFREPVAPSELNEISPASGNPADVQGARVAFKQEKKTSKDEGYIDNLLEKVPYSKSLKSTWNFVDGETDLYVDGLRFDRGNTGVMYQTSAVPFMGDVEGLKFKAYAGKKMKLKIEGSALPFIGSVEGLKYKTSIGEESKISVRYTVPLDKLGL